MRNRSSARRIALIGAEGMLARMIRRQAPESVDLLLYDLPDFDITDRKQVADVLAEAQPDIIINCAAYTQVDACEENRDAALTVNAAGPAALAEAAKQIGALLIHISTDFVFSGAGKEPYCEDDETGPLSVYGKSKLEGEKAVVAGGLEEFYIIRTSWLYGPFGANFVETIIRLAGEREDLGVVSDQIGSPTFTGDLASLIWTFAKRFLAQEGVAPYGIYHYSNDGSCSWYEFAKEIVALLRQESVPLQLKELRPIATAEYPLPAKRPPYSVLSKEKVVTATGLVVPGWRKSLAEYMLSR